MKKTVSGSTVEHALAAVSGLRIDNMLIELTGKEPPVMDGSAKICRMYNKSGIQAQKRRRS